MPLKTLLAGAAALALCAGAAQAATHKQAGTYAEPSQPIAYSKLGDYLKASPSQRAKGDWAIDTTQAQAAAPTGSAVNTSATAPAAPDQAAAPADAIGNIPSAPPAPSSMTPSNPDAGAQPATPQ